MILENNVVYHLFRNLETKESRCRKEKVFHLASFLMGRWRTLVSLSVKKLEDRVSTTRGPAEKRERKRNGENNR